MNDIRGQLGRYFPPSTASEYLGVLFAGSRYEPKLHIFM